jgi:hypothetical protein
MLSVADCIDNRVRLDILQPTERQRIGNQIDAAMILARTDFVEHAWKTYRNGAIRCRAGQFLKHWGSSTKPTISGNLASPFP